MTVHLDIHEISITRGTKYYHEPFSHAVSQTQFSEHLQVCRSRFEYNSSIVSLGGQRAEAFLQKELRTARGWCCTAGGIAWLEYWLGITTELRNALSTSSDVFLLSKHMTYSITVASKGSVILPSAVNPNSSWDICSSSPKTVVPW